jgi:hypothetical protein
MIQPRVPGYSRPSQLSLLRIVDGKLIVWRLRCPGPRPAPCCCRPPSYCAELSRASRPCSSAPPPLLPQAAASHVASLRLACPPPRPCPEARLRAPHRYCPRTCELTEIEWVWIPVRPSVPPRHPAPASTSVGRSPARGFPPGQSPSPLVGTVPRPTLCSCLSALIFFGFER